MPLPSPKKNALMDPEIARTIGQLEAKVEALAEAVSSLKSETHTISKTLSEAKGGWRILLLIGGAFAGIGAAFSHIVNWFSTHFTPPIN